MALTGSEIPEPMTAKFAPAWMIMNARAWLADQSHRAVAQRIAGTAFLIRIVSAVLAYGSQVLLARWMGSHEFGIFVYVWTWVMLIGGLADLGLASAAQRFIPQYGESGALAKLRGYLSGSRWMAFGIATATALLVRARHPSRAAAGSTITPSCRSCSPASACRSTASCMCRTASRAPSTGSISRWCRLISCASSSWSC